MCVLPTIDALCSSDDRRLEFELRLIAVQGQAAVVRALLDAVGRFPGVPLPQLAEEMSRLGRSVLAAAAFIGRASEDAEAGTAPAMARA
jgi:hypothetical protein